MATRRKLSPEAAGIQEALRQAGVKPGGPLGPPGALPGRLHGRYATATVSGATLRCFDWSVEFTLETFDATAHGELWKVRVAGDQTWTARASGYFVAGDTTLIAAGGVSGADPGTVTFTGYQDATPTTAIFTGVGFITRANFSAPMAMVVQEIEITGSGTPSGGI